MIFTSFLREWRELNRFGALDPELRSIVFYAEDSSSWTYFKPIVKELTGVQGKQICYVTSSKYDQVLGLHEENIRAFCIGSGVVRTTFFSSLDADVMVMTIPDLGNYHLKRSKKPVHYVYVFHSLVSTHMIYQPRAFDGFDSILCVGPHHVAEIRATESAYDLKPKELVEAGYGVLDSIISSDSSEVLPEVAHSDQGKRVLVAPSWGPEALLEICGRELVEVLLSAGHYVTVRPHPMTMRHNSKLLDELQKVFKDRSNFTLDLDLASQGTVADSDLMISDWSGAALEYSFGLERPVLYIDVPRKVNNPEYERIDCVPIEVQLRSEIGAVVSTDRLHELPHWVEDLCSETSNWKERIRESRARWVYNVGNSGAIGASYIADLSSSGSLSTRTD
jgi:hypothetical protein